MDASLQKSRLAEKPTKLNVMADIKQPIIGWNFIKKYRLSTGWNRWGDPMLIDKKARIYATMRSDDDDMRRISSLKYVYKNTKLQSRSFRSDQIGAIEYEANKSFQHWSQTQNVKALAEEMPQEIPEKYSKLINKFPSILNVTSKQRRRSIASHIT